MSVLRRPKFTRSSAITPIKLTERDHQILRLIHRHRFLRSSHLALLLDNESQQVLRRLQLLYHHGHLERPRAQLEYYHQGGSRPIVYGLGSKGAAALRKSGISVPPVRWGEKNRSIGRIFLEHALLVSEVTVAIELACRKNGVRLLDDNELLPNGRQKAKRSTWKWHVTVTSRQKLGVIPDRVFGLEFQNPSGGCERAFFFLEADRGTMPVMRKNLSQTSFYRKLLAYEATWSKSIHEQRFGFHRFRVLTVTESAARVKSLANACTQLKTGHGLFLFTDRESLRQCDDVFSLLWRTGRRNEMSRLWPSRIQ